MERQYFCIVIVICFNCLQLAVCKTEIRGSSVCYNKDPCSDKYHTLTCEESRRIAVHHAVYGFKSAATCPTITDCSDAPNGTCCSTNDASDCLLAFHQGGIDQIVEDCNGQSRCSFPSPKTSGTCSDRNVKVSSYSKLYYRCISESTIADFCSVETVRGESTFSVFDPWGTSFQNTSTCSCTVESSDPSRKASIQVYGVYMRLNGTSSTNQCSKLTIYDQDTAYMFGCDNDKKVEGDEQQQEQSLLNTTTPVTVRLALNPTHLPRYVWIGFEANDNSNLVLRCRSDNKPDGPYNQLVADATGIDPDFVAAVLFGVLVIVVVLSITLAGFPWYMRSLAYQIELHKTNAVNAPPVPNGAPKVRRSSRDPKIYVEMDEAMNSDTLGTNIPLETVPYYSETIDNRTNGKRKGEPRMVGMPEVPKSIESMHDVRENSFYLGMDSPTGNRDAYRGSSTFFSSSLGVEDRESDVGSMIYSEPYALMSGSSSFKDDNYTCPSLTSTLTMGSKIAELEEKYEVAFGDGDKDELKRPGDKGDAISSMIEKEDEYLLPNTPELNKPRRASADSLQYDSIAPPKTAEEGRRRSLSYFVNQAFDTDRPPLLPPVMNREPLVDRKPLVEMDEGSVVPADSHFDNSEYFMP